MTAFLAHYRALAAAANQPQGLSQLSGREREIIQVMEQLLDRLTPQERAALLETASDGASSSEAARRQWRAELKLHRILLEQGVLQG
jgi:DNA-directed RNA polymerase specialized sigma24 family protein